MKNKKDLNKITYNHHLNKGDYIKTDTVGKLVIVAIFLFILGPIIIIWAIDSQISSLEESITYLNNNKGFSETIKVVSNSVYMLIKHPIDSTDTMNMDSIYVDSSGGKWRKGAGFAVSGDGWIVTAKHVIDNADEVFVVDYIEGKEKRYKVNYIGTHTNIDLAIIKINKTTIPVNIYNAGEKLPIGYKIGFVGFPSQEEEAKITHDGIISYGEYRENNFPFYNIHAFVNSGHSGGPVFLADSGEVIGFITSRERASNLPVAEYVKNYVDINKLSQDDKNLIFLAKIYNQQIDMFNRQSEMYNILRNEVSDKTQMGVGVVIGVNKVTINQMINEGKKDMIGLT